MRDGAEANVHRYYSEDKDARYNIEIQKTIIARLKEHEVATLTMLEKIFGCPHEEGKDYPDGKSCPDCPFWKDKNRFDIL